MFLFPLKLRAGQVNK